jgi:LemA protein
MSAQNIALIVALLLLIITFSYFIGIYNKLVMLKNNIEKAFMNIDVILMQRAEEVPELVKVASKYMEHEKSMLTSLTKLRTDFLNAKTIDEKIENANRCSPFQRIILNYCRITTLWSSRSGYRKWR